ncbi:hypothetical protein [Fusibacter tunisiensis]|uniref:Uncharacterized protein n=1 Tax=Fusibacter tunisiensis TaxID=1008308 RepID=A0ABS2MU37_9FIRM|nr:hypothetical protein [Fusibacter tunisiensis]MBM7562948.1 hypothetical protein [Fusibacter tunisiensis]
MSTYEKYNLINMDVTLLYGRYSFEDLNSIMEEPFRSEYQTKVGFQWHPSVVGSDFISISIVFGALIGGIAGGVLSEIGTDLYNWTKNSLRKAIEKRSNFDESRISLSFKDKEILIYTNTKEEIILTLENVEKIVLKISKDEQEGNLIEIESIATYIEDEK